MKIEPSTPGSGGDMNLNVGPVSNIERPVILLCTVDKIATIKMEPDGTVWIGKTCTGRSIASYAILLLWLRRATPIFQNTQKASTQGTRTQEMVAPSGEDLRKNTPPIPVKSFSPGAKGGTKGATDGRLHLTVEDKVFIRLESGGRYFINQEPNETKDPFAVHRRFIDWIDKLTLNLA